MIDWKPYRAELDALAQAWMKVGATAFALYEHDNLLLSYPNDCPADAPLLLVTPPKFPSIKLALWGELEASCFGQAQAQVVLLATLFRQERELESVTAALVERQDQLLTFYNLNQELRPHLVLDESLTSIAAAARQMLQVGGTCVIFLDGRDTRRASSGTYEHSSELETFAMRMLAAGVKAQHEATFCIPLRIHGEYGATLLWQGRLFDSPDIKLMDAVAEQAAAHLETVMFYRETLARERLSREMELARQVQSYLLPRRTLFVEGLDIFAASVPALSVGGDFFDFLTGSCGHQMFIVGDVSGKGVPAAMIMAMTRSVLRCTASALNLTSPRDIIDHLSAELYDDFTEIGVFVTLFIAKFDPVRQVITVANAGHSPVMYHAPGEKPRFLDADGVPIGTMPSNFCEDQTLSFTPGTALLIGTDGFAEAFTNSGEMFGYDRLLGLVEATASVSARDSATFFFETLRRFRDKHPQDDDQTLMIIKRTAVK